MGDSISESTLDLENLLDPNKTSPEPWRWDVLKGKLLLGNDEITFVKLHVYLETTAWLQ